MITLPSPPARHLQATRTLFVSENTVKFHLSTLMEALDARTRTECLSKAQRLGLLDAFADRTSSNHAIAVAPFLLLWSQYSYSEAEEDMSHPLGERLRCDDCGAEIVFVKACTCPEREPKSHSDVCCGKEMQSLGVDPSYEKGERAR